MAAMPMNSLDAHHRPLLIVSPEGRQLLMRVGDDGAMPLDAPALHDVEMAEVRAAAAAVVDRAANIAADVKAAVTLALEEDRLRMDQDWCAKKAGARMQAEADMPMGSMGSSANAPPHAESEAIEASVADASVVGASAGASEVGAPGATMGATPRKETYHSHPAEPATKEETAALEELGSIVPQAGWLAEDDIDVLALDDDSPAAGVSAAELRVEPTRGENMHTRQRPTEAASVQETGALAHMGASRPEELQEEFMVTGAELVVEEQPEQSALPLEAVDGASRPGTSCLSAAHAAAEITEVRVGHARQPSAVTRPCEGRPHAGLCGGDPTVIATRESGGADTVGSVCSLGDAPAAAEVTPPRRRPWTSAEELHSECFAPDVDRMGIHALREEVRRLRCDNALLRQAARLADDQAAERQRAVLKEARLEAAKAKLKWVDAEQQLETVRTQAQAEAAAAIAAERRVFASTLEDLKEAAVMSGCWRRLNAACIKLKYDDADGLIAEGLSASNDFHGQYSSTPRSEPDEI
jgi:hypothetical protein